ncbi:MAG: hypothetical protein PUG48_00365 [Clostridia bacterium]|nr:hypothetical protein [Clostridia bacterium]
MKLFKKAGLVISLMAMATAVFSANVSAATVSDGIQTEISVISQDSNNASIEAVVKNTNDYAIDGINCKLSVSENAVLNGEDAKKDISLAGGNSESLKAEIRLNNAEETDPTEQSTTSTVPVSSDVEEKSDNNAVQTGQNNNVIPVAILCIVSLAVVSAILCKKKNKRMLSVILCLCLTIPVFSAGLISVDATDGDSINVITDEAVITINGTDITVTFTVEYPDVNNENKIEYPITMEKIKEAAKTGNLLKSYSSFAMNIENPTVNNPDAFIDYSYCDKDFYYTECKAYAALFVDGKMEYINSDGKKGRYMYVKTEPITADTENLFFNEELSRDETITSSKKDGDVIYVSTIIKNAEITAQIEQMYSMEYKEGDYMHCDYVLDANTLIPLSVNESIIRSDGTSEDFLNVITEINADRPATAQELYGYYTQTTDLRTVTIISDPDTPEEETFSVSVPKNVGVLPNISKDYGEIHIDRECTQKYTGGADPAKDATFYIRKKTEITENYPITMEEIKEAARTVNILKKYDSFGFKSEYLVKGGTETNPMYVYCDHDVYYGDSIFYDDPDLTKAIYIDGELKYSNAGGVSGAYLFAKMNPYDDSFFKNIFMDEEKTAEEIILSSKKDGDKIYVETKSTEKNTASTLEFFGIGYKDGDYMKVDYVLDADTYIPLSVSEKIVSKDGTSYDFWKGVTEINTDKPEMAKDLYGYYTQTTDLRTVTIISDPNTSEEESFSVNVPKNIKVYPYIPEEYEGFYIDRECTQKYTGSADLAKDATFYIRKKTEIVENYPITMEEIKEASKTGNILKNYSSFSMNIENPTVDNPNTFIDYSYCDKDFYYSECKAYAALFVDGKMEYINSDGKKGRYMYVKTEPIAADNENLFYNEELSQGETITSSKKDGDVIYVSTVIKNAELIVQIEKMYSMEYKDGDYIKCDYVLDADTLIPLSLNELIIRSDGTSVDFMKIVTETNVDRPEMANELYGYYTQTTDLRTVTVISDPDTPEEEIFSVNVPKNINVYPFIPKDYEGFYINRECTQKYTGGADPAKDATFYIRKKSTDNNKSGGN